MCLLKLTGLVTEPGVSFSLSSCEFYCVNFTHADLEQRWKALLSVILVLAGKHTNQFFHFDKTIFLNHCL